MSDSTPSTPSTPAGPREPSAEAELRKLAHSLGIKESALTMVAGVSGSDLRLLRSQIGQALFDNDKHYFARIAALAKSVPVGVTAKLTEAVVSPVIAARVAELLDTSKGAELVSRLPARYLADVAAAMDVSRSPGLIAAIPADRVSAVGAELAAREEWVVIGGFVSYLTEAALKRTVAVFAGAHLLRVAYVMDSLDRLDQVAGLLTDAQRADLLAAAPEQAAWVELADLVAHLGDQQRQRLAASYAQLPGEVHDAYRAAVAEGRLDAEVLAVVAG